MHKSRLLYPLLLVLLLSAPCLGQTKDPDPEPQMDDFVLVTDEPMPIVPVERLVQYPDSARRNGIEGRIMLTSLIEKDGSVSKVVVAKGGPKILEDEAVRAMKIAKFTPAMDDGKPVRVWMSKTITFRLVNQPATTDSTSHH